MNKNQDYEEPKQYHGRWGLRHFARHANCKCDLITERRSHEAVALRRSNARILWHKPLNYWIQYVYQYPDTIIAEQSIDFGEKCENSSCTGCNNIRPRTQQHEHCTE